MPLFKLSIYHNPVSWVDADTYPEVGGCHLVCLSERQCATIRQVISPLLHLPNRFARRIFGNVFERGDPDIYQEHLAEIGDLLYQIGGGSDVACTELVASITALAEAIAAGAGVSGGQTIVNCGGGGTAITPTGQLAQCLSGEITDILPAEDIVEPPGTGAPPEGFDTWEEFRTYKCQAAHWVFDTIVNAMRNLGAANLAASTLSLLSASVFGGLGLLAGIMAAPAFLALVGILAQLEILAAAANSLLRQVADHMDERRETIICAMYLSGSAADATEVLSSALDDAIEALIYGPAYEAAAGSIAPLLTEATTYFVDLGVTRTMWQLSADVVYPDAECDCSGDPGDLWWHFSASTEGWTLLPEYENGRVATGSWQNPGHNGADPQDEDTISEGCLEAHVTGPAVNFSVGWEYVFAAEYRPIAAGGFVLHYDVRAQPDAAWGTVGSIIYTDDTQDTQDLNGNSVWGHMALPVSGPNIGKTVAKLQVTMHAGADVGECWLDFDNIHFVYTP